MQQLWPLGRSGVEAILDIELTHEDEAAFER